MTPTTALLISPLIKETGGENAFILQVHMKNGYFPMDFSRKFNYYEFFK